MRILVIADEESKALWDYYTPERTEGVDLIISCGDLKASFLEFLVTLTNCPVLYVPGNHDSAYEQNPPEGCENIDGRIYRFQGVRILGLGGSMKYKNGPYMYTEAGMRHRIWKTRWDILKNGGFDILVTHAPAKGYGDMEDLPHRGYECFNTLLNICHPAYMLHGHVHASYMSGFKRETLHSSGTKLINAYEKYTFDFEEKDRQTIKRMMLMRNMMGKFV
ncbi:MAG: metallophosphoesterase [Lachnospiraceae bacterium]|nr:metallophosphoesterase [Lachnospiraceae bacterium]